MPNRIIKESINESRALSMCSDFAQDLYKRLITYADDYGRFNADTEIMRARLYPRELDIITQDDVVDALVELCGVEKIQFYTAAARHDVYGCFPKWGDHQRIRESKKGCPEPSDTGINDWYLRRFVSIDMKAKIIDRDGFKCQICGKFLTTMRDTKRFAKLGSGLYHIDHIVPCQQGGRVTLENLRLTCPSCNLSRKKAFSFDEIVAFTKFPKDAANCGELRQDAASCARAESNPIQSNPIRIQSESNPKESAPAQRKLGEFGWVRLTDNEYDRLLRDLGHEELDRCISYVDESAQSTGNKNKWKDWNLTVRKCSRDGWGKKKDWKQPEYTEKKRPAPTVEEVDRMKAFLKKLKEEQ